MANLRFSSKLQNSDIVASVDNIQELTNMGLTDTPTGKVALIDGLPFSWNGSSWVPVREVSLKSMGAVGDGVTNDSSAVQAAIDLAKIHGSKTVYVNRGVFSCLSFSLPSNIKIVGEDKYNSVLKLRSTSGMPTRTASTNISGNVQQTYRPFIYSETLGNGKGGQNISNILLENFTIDWNNIAVGNYAAAPLILGNCVNSKIVDINFANCLPSDYSNATTQGRSVSLLLAYVDDILVQGCDFLDAAGYEEFGIRYSAHNVLVFKNKFSGNGPWRHNLELASLNNITGEGNVFRNISIKDNDFELKGNKQDVLSCHDGGDVVFSNNRVRVSSSIVDTSQSGLRCLVKRFDAGEGSLVVTDNFFDFTDVPSTLKQAFEVVRIWADNVIVKGNIIRGKMTSFDNSLEPVNIFPWVGTGENIRNPKNVVISNNSFELYDYNSTQDFYIIKVAGNSCSVVGNTLTVVTPTTVSNNGPIFIDMNGADSSVVTTPDGESGGYSTTIVGNTAYSALPNSIKTTLSVRGSITDSQYVLLGNVDNCAVNTITGNPTVTSSTTAAMRVAYGNIGTGAGAERQFTAEQAYTPPPQFSVGGAGDVETISVPGAKLGDFVTVSYSQSLNNLTVIGWVSSNGTVSVRFSNNGNSAVSISAGTIKVFVRGD